MSDTGRVARWRQRMRDEGKEPMTIWLSRDEKLRLEDLARTWRGTPSAMVEQALAQFRPGSPSVTATVPDTEQLRVLMQEALLETTAVTELVTDIVTATLARDLPMLVRESVESIEDKLAVPHVTDTDSNVADTSPLETPQEAPPASQPEAPAGLAPQRKGGRRRSPTGQRILTLLADHPEGLSAEDIRVHLKATKPLGDTLQGMKRTGTVTTQGQGQRYVLAEIHGGGDARSA